jgi:membrane protein implicated in regulation of membrane protease activity
LLAAQGAGAVWQLAGFAIFNAVLLILVRPIAQRALYHRSDTRPTNAHALIGQTGIVVEPIPAPHQPGRVKLGGEEWRALSADGTPVSENTLVEIIHIDSATLTVRPLPISNT